ncbi:hypothetical protein BGZ63DRAFT_17477 [Mariannaea sp. PMI_226]|nr:hypothetical protein BGZ63DRAFT_17477 [Mariannaea sp. PMI_226]
MSVGYRRGRVLSSSSNIHTWLIPFTPGERTTGYITRSHMPFSPRSFGLCFAVFKSFFYFYIFFCLCVKRRRYQSLSKGNLFGCYCLASTISSTFSVSQLYLTVSFFGLSSALATLLHTCYASPKAFRHPSQ